MLTYRDGFIIVLAVVFWLGIMGYFTFKEKQSLLYNECYLTITSDPIIILANTLIDEESFNKMSKDELIKHFSNSLDGFKYNYEINVKQNCTK